ncbi:MAG: DNA repair protein RadC [Chloroflexi bacterium]|nr:DNA repair protein RadC [Chloroflexota bacterium]
MEDKGSIEYHPRIQDLPSAERPRERLRHNGADKLSDAELLAIILRTGAHSVSALELANGLVAKFKGLRGLAQAGFADLCELKGLGEAKAAQVKAALELAKRLAAARQEEKPTVSSPRDVFDLLKPEMDLLEQEHMHVVLLNTRNEVVATPLVYKGNVNTSLIRINELFRDAVRYGCPSLIVVHNHPSGDPKPSPEDIEVTRQIVGAGKLLQIEVLDHIVIGNGYVSLKEQGLGFKDK